MEIAAIESADNIIEHHLTELPISTLYGSYTRTLNEVRNEVIRIRYGEYGERSKEINWPTRRELLKKFLVGTTPFDHDVYNTIVIYQELEKNHALKVGPLDLQYKSYLKESKQKRFSLKSQVNLVKNLASMKKL